MKKRIVAVILAFMMCFGVFSVTFADQVAAGESRVAIGADLTAEQRAAILKEFGISNTASVTQISVTNADERAYLEGIAPEEKIGHKALSCVFITTLSAGQGLQISTHNINWCTSEMYINALTTAGITDAKVMVTAPFPVSGTAALTGIYKAYEAISGTSLSELAKSVGVEELVLTGELAEYIGSAEATQLINELKSILDQTQNMTDDEVREEIKRLCTQYNVQLTDGQIEQVLKLCRQLEKLDVNELKQKLLNLTQTVQTASKVQQTLSKIGESVKNFFVSIGNFFSKLFGGNGN